ncbi:hypothetical protein, partial [Klebsiella michiganensis]|uniref:hypothetical protein n=1 Tax=Klebsiella michiganensis TaxID=1134687 RepID=UPI0035D63B6A
MLTRSPSKRSSSREENRSKASGSAPYPEAARCACPVYPIAGGCEPVAWSAQRHREENRSKASGSAPFPEAARCACPGYRSAEGCEPVARLSAAHAGKKTAARH